MSEQSSCLDFITHRAFGAFALRSLLCMQSNTSTSIASGKLVQAFGLYSASGTCSWSPAQRHALARFAIVQAMIVDKLPSWLNVLAHHYLHGSICFSCRRNLPLVAGREPLLSRAAMRSALALQFYRPAFILCALTGTVLLSSSLQSLSFFAP
jgi:hypothetical protein